MFLRRNSIRWFKMSSVTAFFLLLSVFLVFIPLLVQTYVKSHSPPHILFMLADDLGWSDVGFHGSKIQTPNIDRLAKEGVILNNYYVQPICSPTRGALMTGRYPIHTGLQHAAVPINGPFGLPLDFQTLPGQLGKAGYSTHLVGKWHLGFHKWPYIPTKRGFDSAYGFWGGRQDHFDHARSGILDFRNGSEPVRSLNGTYATYAYLNRIKEIVDSHDSEKPLFLYVAFQNVHYPIQAPDEYVAKYQFIDSKMRRTHAGMADILDEAVGNITKMFQKAGLWENTLTIFSTDNGAKPTFGGYNWPLRGTKSTLWEGGVRGVGLVHGNMLEKTGVKCEGLLHISDFFPTLITLAGGSFDPVQPILIDGFDVWNTISRGDPSPRTEILLNIDNAPEDKEGVETIGAFQGMALRMGDMKLLMNVPNITWFKPPEMGRWIATERLDWFDNLDKNRIEAALYNITADPEERNDLSDKLPDVLENMKKRLQFYVNSSVPPQFKPSDPNALKEARKRGVWGPWM